MNINLECIPCFSKQALDAARTCNCDYDRQRIILIKVLEQLINFHKYKSSPELGEIIYSIVRTYSGINDPYLEIKQRSISLGLRYYPKLFEFLAQRKEKLYWAFKISAIGNLLDAAMYSNLDIEDRLESELLKPFYINNLNSLEKDLNNGRSLLVIGDNAGETVFDKFLLEFIKDSYPAIELYYGVRGEPVINDATVKDALDSGLDNIAQVISTGCAAPGLLLEKADDSFKELFNKVDIVISKGQGNHGALKNESRKIYFVLKAKCNVIANNLDVPINEYVLWCNREHLKPVFVKAL